MKLETCINLIEKYMNSNDYHPRIVNVKNCDDMNSIITHFNVGYSMFKDVSDYSKEDQNPNEAALLNDLRLLKGCVFLTGFTTHYKLLGEKKLRDFLLKILSFTGSDLHLIVLCYQCDRYLTFDDIRYKTWIYEVDGDVSPCPVVTFLPADIPTWNGEKFIEGIENLSRVIETSSINKLFLLTMKEKSSYPYTLIEIEEKSDSYEILCSQDSMISSAEKELGSSREWLYLLNQLKDELSFSSYVEHNFTNPASLDLILKKWRYFDPKTKWVYFIALKIFKVQNNEYFKSVIDKSNNISDFIENIYNHILSISPSNPSFFENYHARKYMISEIGDKNVVELASYCDLVLHLKGEDGLYYLTDSTEEEINIIYMLLNKYSSSYSLGKLYEILSNVYPDLFSYLSPYDYKIDLLNDYFKKYKYQKVTNKLDESFVDFVNEQALKRDYLRLLPSRSSLIESIPMPEKTLVFFVDAMGVEYMSYIMAMCKARGLFANTSLCHCELPSLTERNKDFIPVFRAKGADFLPNENGIKQLDEIKHHGEEIISPNTGSLPIYLHQELQILKDIIQKAFDYLHGDIYKKVILISDHGASRLCILSGQETKYTMELKGEHSGRCCPKSPNDTQHDCVVDCDDCWVIANYNRFKGSRRAEVEVHGGATIEEVTIPIIEITKSITKYEFILLTPNIKFSKRKRNAAIRIFSKEKLDSITVRLSGLSEMLYTNTNDGHTFDVKIPNMCNAGEYKVSIYSRDNLLATDLILNSENSDFSEKDLF